MLYFALRLKKTLPLRQGFHRASPEGSACCPRAQVHSTEAFLFVEKISAVFQCKSIQQSLSIAFPRELSDEQSGSKAAFGCFPLSRSAKAPDSSG